ncbi:unnamed protein product [Strongylus vulgaris]|uniref:BZIP domain-containing protein n=1 Tax=Strongylus vulgaris TaxID=40348 RepID=A0A3P7JD50_STRVU|nr:unnamed protein product [Strongylus vulgaris]
MDEQEKRKLDRKRARNRAAATKCRQKKIDRIQELEGLVGVQSLHLTIIRLRHRPPLTSSDSYLVPPACLLPYAALYSDQ